MEAPLQPGFRLDLIFSGFNAEYRLQLHETIFDIVWFGEGRWSWQDIYEMPIFLRRYWVKRVNRIIKERDEYNQKLKQQRKSSSKSSVPTKPRR